MEDLETKNNDEEILIKENQPIDTKKEILSWLKYILIALVISFLLITFVIQKTKVNGMSMYSTLNDGDSMFVDKISYRFSDPKRFDIIVFPHPDKSRDINLIKRIIGLPGETVQIKDGEIYINNKKIKDPHRYGENINPGRANSKIKLGDDEYFVLGDNRENSSDSRFENVGNIKFDTIIGKAFVRVSPNFEFFINN